ncbi:MAG: tetratricopeptide repeat protein [Pseudanabaenaceae cyanobacterium]
MPVSASNLVAWGVQCLQRGDRTSALINFEQALWLQPNYPEALLWRGVAHLELGNLAQALTDLNLVISALPHDPRAYYYRGQIYRQQNETIRAIADYRQAVVLQPDWLIPYSPLSELLFAAGNYSELIPYLETLEKAGAGSDTLYYQLGCAYRYTNQIGKAVAYLRRIPHHEPAQKELKEIYRQKVMDWHFPMMNDAVRNQAFDQALRQLVQPHMTVLDIGAGSGLLSMQAVRAGAKQVFTCEMEPIIADIAQKIIAKNGYSDRIHLFQRDSRTLKVPEDLPHRANLLVTETFGSWLFSEGCLGTIVHAREHLLQPDAPIIPCSAVIYLALVEVPQLYQRFWVHHASGFDLSPFNEISPFLVTAFVGQIDTFSPRWLSAPYPLPAIDFQTCPPEFTEMTVAIPVTTSGTLHAICSWFDLYLTPEIVITTHPDQSLAHNATCWGQWTRAFPTPLEVTAGAIVKVQVTEHDVWLHPL